jgi:hypothetical protein
MKVDSLPGMLETMRVWMLEKVQFLSFLSRIVSVTSTFTFQSPEQFEDKARQPFCSGFLRWWARCFM